MIVLDNDSIAQFSLDECPSDGISMTEIASVQRIYENNEWQEICYDEYLTQFFLSFSMMYSSVEHFEEIAILYDLNNFTFLHDIKFINWLYDASCKLIEDSMSKHLICIATHDVYLKYLNETHKKLVALLQK